MSDIVLKAENISKQYRLGQLGTGTISHDLNRWWHRVRGKEDPYLRLGEENDRAAASKGEYVWSLKDINFDVANGEVLGIIGKNGAGKSTLLKILSQVTNPTTGAVKIKGRIASLLEVGTGFHPELTGKENIFLNGAILGMTKKEISAKFNEIVEFSGVARYVDTPVKRYSSGMMVRLGFAVAAHLEPEILVVDEVLAVGDAEFQDKCIGKMKDVSRQGRTVLFVSHNMASIKSLCNRVLVLEKGKVVYNGNVADGITRYLSSSSSSLNNGTIEKHHRTINSGQVFFKELRVNNAEFKNGNSIYFNKNISITCLAEFKEKISDTVFDFRILSADGLEILHSMNIYESDLMEVKPGLIELQVQMENKLQPGKYFMNFGIHKSDGRTIEYLENIIELNVLNVAEDNKPGLVYEFKLAYYRPNTKWTVKQL